MMNLRKDHKMSQRDKIKLMNSEVRSFYEYCKAAGISDEEMDLICRPLTSAVRNASIKKWTKVLLVFIMGLAIGYTVSQTETFQWHATAIARIALIKVRPFWDWSSLYSNKCVIDRAQPPIDNNDYSLSTECEACEAIKTVSKISDTTYSEVYNHHLLIGAPVIITDSNSDWADKKTELNLTLFLEKDDRLRGSVPCRVLTNLRVGNQPMDLDEIVSRITEADVPSWFLHFQNCDIRAVKSFRVLAPRPYFLAPRTPPSHFSWLLISKNYETHRYKHLELDEGLIVMSQIKGNNKIQLRPRPPCENECATLNIDLNEGEAMILSNELWEFEYLPSKGENFAMITETDWSI